MLAPCTAVATAKYRTYHHHYQTSLELGHTVVFIIIIVTILTNGRCSLWVYDIMHAVTTHQPYIHVRLPYAAARWSSSTTTTSVTRKAQNANNVNVWCVIMTARDQVGCPKKKAQNAMFAH
jgi:hypothetical protein